ncbi:MAG: hypothetical protein GX644_03015 [Limnobacter sp.]|nr:hypothetical protein [Limnobacter sp.]
MDEAGPQQPAEPASPQAPLAGRLARSGAGAFAGALIAGIDHLLEQNEWARTRLAPHVGRHVVIGVEGRPLPGLPDPRLVATIVEGGRLKVAEGADPSTAAVTMLLRPSLDAAFDLARDGARGLSRHLRLEGDVMLAAALGEIARHLRWDAVEDLSRLTGDVIAERIGRFASGTFAALRDAGSRLESNAARYLAVESGRLVDRGALELFAQQLDSLERRIAALEAAPTASRNVPTDPGG